MESGEIEREMASLTPDPPLQLKGNSIHQIILSRLT